ncbi:hypothetical protein A9179_20445 [Pseudomonas alcaligenes]|uniref:DUF4153 domain-containing protein n=1 Tax=Aquipseudomonas alcaligenes TaxID=43263 RepID=A0ABR7S4Y3_AQUAC|nr:DUF4153 domain-containing protein [Pseudomonas alcaligenes]MBC9252642.1 hypothetical protein [Pseudomonas alcaligenes]
MSVSPSRSLFFYLAIGLAQGLLLWWGLSLGDASRWLASLACALITLSLVGGLGLQLLGGHSRERGALTLLAALAGLMALISGWLFWQARPFDDSGSDDAQLLVSWSLCAQVLGYIGIAFILSWPTRAQGRLRYEDLFRHAWNNVFILLLALLLVGIFCLLLGLWGGLFVMLGIELFSDLFSSRGFMAISPLLVFAVGVRMGHANERVIGLLRGVLLALCRFLLPLSALIAVLFSLALPLTGLQAIWSTGHSTAILLCLVLLNLLFINGVFQDGGEAQAYPRPLRRLVELAILCLVPLAAIAGYSLYLRIGQYGLTPQRVYAALLVLVSGVHALALLWALRPRQAVWLGSLRRSNPPIALLLCALLVVLHSPWLNPLELSARSQVQRLLAGQVSTEAFDLDHLRYELGRPGRQHFDALQARLEAGELFDGKQRSQLLARMQQVVEQGRAGQLADASPAMPAQTLAWIGPAEDETQRVVDEQSLKDECDFAGCLLWAVDMDGDGRNEVLLLPTQHYGSALLFFARAEQGKWQVAGRFEQVYSTEELIEAARAGTVQKVAPRYQSLRVGQQLLVPLPPEE